MCFQPFLTFPKLTCNLELYVVLRSPFLVLIFCVGGGVLWSRFPTSVVGILYHKLLELFLGTLLYKIFLEFDTYFIKYKYFRRVSEDQKKWKVVFKQRYKSEKKEILVNGSIKWKITANKMLKNKKGH